MNWQAKQQINFYLDEFKPPQFPEDLRFILTGYAASLIFFFLLSIGLTVNMKSQESRFEKVKSRYAQIEQEVANLEKERPPVEINAALSEQRDEYRSDLESARQILRYLSYTELQQSRSFTNLVEELGQQNISGVWLDTFKFDDAGENLTLEGFTDDPSKVSQYADSLLKRNSYKNYAFRVVDISKDEKTGWIKFKLDTRFPEDKEPSGEKTKAKSAEMLLSEARL
ncbi:MAG: hypothetical protein P1U57_00735 [Oleibacter sp.]|nr:hypothetical protein [Thalassolituus sp.]